LTVYLVGAGPGDPGLLTVRGAEVLASADVVCYDSLAEVTLLDRAPASAERVFVGKRPGAAMAQDAINALLVERGRAHERVVRLKGGDPFVFGRGGEEAQALIAAGVEFEVVPGVSSAIAVPAYAGVPVTQRGLSTSFTVVTGHSRHAIDTETNWEALAQAGGTIVVLMGVSHRGEIASRLMAAGLPATTPVAAVHWGTRPEQRTVRTTLADLPATLLEPPVTMVVGRVAALDLGWWEAARPLSGRRIVVTRARDQASELIGRLRDLGAEVVELPTIAITGPADEGAALRAAVGNITGYDWVVFSSANAVERTLCHLRDARALGSVRIAVVGAATADALSHYRLVADLVPERFLAEGLVEVFPDGPGRVLVPRAAAARDTLPDGLRSRGWDVDVVEAYRTQAVQPSGAELAAARKADAVTFSSSSTVTNYLRAAGGDGVPPVVACIGPVTATTATDAGLRVDVVATTSTVVGLVDALVAHLAGHRGS